MRSRSVGVLAVLVAVALAGGLVAAWRLRGGRGAGTPEEIAADYFAAWRRGALDDMRDLVADPPGDFARQYRALSRGLTVTSIMVEPRPVVRTGPGAAHADFTVTRTLAGHGEWSFEAVLRLGRVDGRWRVLWTPATLYPGLKGRGTWSLAQVRLPAVTLVARDGKALPDTGLLAPYLAELVDDLTPEGYDEARWVIEMRDGDGPPQRVKVLGGAPGRKIRTTLDRRWQTAAEKAVRSVPKAAAIVALRPSTGEVLAVADALGGLGAFAGLYPPGSTFKVVTAGGLIADGAGPGTPADCPASVVTAQRTIRNDEGHELGRTTLSGAFAASCNTTFARLGVESLGAGKLAASARRFGFETRFSPGVRMLEGGFPSPRSGAELAEAAIGQGRVQASPLLMASVAAAVADGSWRPPRLVAAKLVRESGGDTPDPHPIPGAAALRSMMRAVVTGGTAAGAGLPDGTAGKTGTAEYSDDGSAHAWFIGYRGDLAFSVFVQDGGSGPRTAAPLAAAFLR
ncbi:penicillin-binding transpeptidase domain-containing protein [Actinomadura nitritigenes]|uniref:penicillin-binding transpeptidase domain-containing protein n=1 Tax=Actinomadura nitritigenes TaxID=134602 RepID=UPI0036904A48